MNEIMQKHAEKVATQAVAEKYASGDAMQYVNLKGPEQFVEDVCVLTEKILALAASFGTQSEPVASTVKIKVARKPRKEGMGTPSGKGGGVTPETLLGFLGGREAQSLQQIAEYFSVSKGVAQRAVDALGDKVKSEPGTKPEGQRGKAPTVYFLAE